MRGQALHHRSGRDLRVDAVGHVHEHPLGHHGQLGVTARNLRPGDQITDCRMGDTGTGLPDRADTFGAGHQRQRQRIAPLSVVDVDEIDAGGGHLDEHLAGARHRIGAFGVGQGLGSAVGVDDNRMHPPSLCGAHSKGMMPGPVAGVSSSYCADSRNTPST